MSTDFLAALFGLQASQLPTATSSRVHVAPLSPEEAREELESLTAKRLAGALGVSEVAAAKRLKAARTTGDWSRLMDPPQGEPRGTAASQRAARPAKEKPMTTNVHEIQAAERRRISTLMERARGLGRVSEATALLAAGASTHDVGRVFDSYEGRPGTFGAMVHGAISPKAGDVVAAILSAARKAQG